jgi:diguanylate cyclase
VRIIGFGRREDADAPQDQPAAQVEPLGICDHVAASRARLLGDICAFIEDNQLEVTPENLFLAQQALSGEHSGLAAQIAARRIAHQEITGRWLLETGRELGVARDRKSEIAGLMERLEGVLEAFLPAGQTAAQRAPDFDAPTLVEAARAMIERTREVEGEMERAEIETMCLRDRLQRAQHEAQIDHLTGLPNRRAFDALYERECCEARAASEDLCVALCDVDNFKAINDAHGHGVGDRVIRAVAQHLKSLSGDRCHVARHGGEEFVLLFRGIGLAAATDRLDEARAAFASRRPFDRDTDEALSRVTYSGGITSVFAHAGASDALRAADVALYAAKSAGRNRIEIG